MKQTMEVAELIDGRRLSGLQIGLTVLCLIVLVFDGYDSLSLGALVPTLAAALHAPPSAFGPVFAAGLAGLGLGSLLCGWTADKFGRRPLIMFCVAAFGLFTLAKVLVTSVMMLLVLQFIAGLALGGASPNAIALVLEYSPKRLRATLVAIAGAGLAIGGALSSFSAAFLIPTYGWQSVFYVGGILPLLLMWPLFQGLPESLRLMIVKNRSRADIARVLAKINPGVPPDNQPVLVSPERDEGLPVAHLFRNGRAPMTILLWVASVLDLMTIYFVLSWLTALGHSAGMPIKQAILLNAVYQIAGIFGPFLVGPMMDRFGAPKMLTLSFLLAAAFCAPVGYLATSFGVAAAIVFAVGFFSVGSHIGLAAYTGEVYPTFMRSTGVGWMVGVGRVISLLSPLFGGLLIALQWTPTSIFMVVALVPLSAAVVLLILARLRVPTSASDPLMAA